MPGTWADYNRDHDRNPEGENPLLNDDELDPVCSEEDKGHYRYELERENEDE